MQMVRYWHCRQDRGKGIEDARLPTIDEVKVALYILSWSSQVRGVFLILLLDGDYVAERGHAHYKALLCKTGALS